MTIFELVTDNCRLTFNDWSESIWNVDAGNVAVFGFSLSLKHQVSSLNSLRTIRFQETTRFLLLKQVQFRHMNTLTGLIF